MRLATPCWSSPSQTRWRRLKGYDRFASVSSLPKTRCNSPGLTSIDRSFLTGRFAEQRVALLPLRQCTDRQMVGAALRKEVRHETTSEGSRDDRCGTRTDLSAAAFHERQTGSGLRSTTVRNGSTCAPPSLVDQLQAETNSPIIHVTNREMEDTMCHYRESYGYEDRAKVEANRQRELDAKRTQAVDKLKHEANAAAQKAASTPANEPVPAK
jgi:hypothetical protein